MTGEKSSLCGFINILKPPGMSSAQVVGRVRYLLKGTKIGHAGTLDPEAAGVLPLMIGKATRLFDYMQEKEKAYIAEIAFGVSTKTQDAQGEVSERGENYPSKEALNAIIPSFRGEIMQQPPMVSAIKRGGVPLYALALQGETVDIEKRQVTVYELENFGEMENHGFRLYVKCSKGFYVRTLCHDIGEKLGCPAHMRFLLRTKSGVFTLDNAFTLEQIETASINGTLENVILPMNTVLTHIQHVEVPSKYHFALMNGTKIPIDALESSEIKIEKSKPFVLCMNERIVGIAKCVDDKAKICTWLA